MISDFICLEPVCKHDNLAQYKCMLPDPDPYGEERMVQCGIVICRECCFAEYDSIIEIELSETFVELCIGDLYQRREFARTIELILEMDYGLEAGEVLFNIKDPWGNCSGCIESLDKSIWGV